MRESKSRGNVKRGKTSLRPTKPPPAPKPKLDVGQKVEAFVSDIETDIDSQVRKLSLDAYYAWLVALRDAFNEMLNSRVQACQSDMARR